MTTPSTARPTPDQCEQIFHAALRAGDGRGVEGALRLMTLQDPHRAERLFNTLKMALAIANAIHATPEKPMPDLNRGEAVDFAEDLTERARWARRCNDGHPAPAWSTREKLAVYVLLEDTRALASAGFTTTQAVQWIADGMLEPPADMNAWFSDIRSELAAFGDPAEQ